MRLGRLEISGGALMAMALLYYLDNSGVTLWVLLGCFLHEAGHWWAIRAFGGRVVLLRITGAGAELRLSRACPLSQLKTLLAALAGPGANLLAAWISVGLARRRAELYFFAGLNLGLACFNLLPAGWLDGGKALEALFSLIGREEAGRRLTELCSEAAAGLLLAGGLVLLWQSGGRNFTVLIAGLWLACAARQERRREGL